MAYQANQRVAAYLAPTGFVRWQDAGKLGCVLTEGRRFCVAAATAAYQAPAYGPVACAGGGCLMLHQRRLGVIVDAGCRSC